MAGCWVLVDGITVHLGVSKDTAFTKVKERGMPSHKAGRLWKFKVGEVDDCIRAGGPNSEPSRKEAK